MAHHQTFELILCFAQLILFCSDDEMVKFISTQHLRTRAQACRIACTCTAMLSVLFCGL